MTIEAEREIRRMLAKGTKSVTVQAIIERVVAKHAGDLSDEKKWRLKRELVVGLTAHELDGPDYSDENEHVVASE